MREYQQKHIVRTLLYSRVTMVILFLLIVLLLRSIMELNDKRIEVNVERDETAKERQDLESKVEKIRKQNEFIKTERGFEEYVRTTYPVVKEGEGVIVIYDDESQSVSEVREKMTAWEKISVYWNSFFRNE
jgi:cell division protein FtsB